MASKITESFVTIQSSDGVDIPGIYTKPGIAPILSVLLLHGITTQKNEYGNFFGRIAQSLANVGIESLRIDFRGHGDSDESSRKFTIASQVLDTLAAVDWLSKQSSIRTIHLLGCSFGSPPAIYTSEIRKNQIASISLICPVLDYGKTFLKPTTEWAASIFNERTLDQAFTKGILKMNSTFSIDVKLIVEMEILKPYETLKSIATPTLIIHGEADSMVPYSISVESVHNQKHVRLIGIRDMDHGFTDKDDETGDSLASQKNFDRIVREIISHIQATK